MAVIETENFESGSNGAAITITSTSFDQVTGTATHSNTAPYSGGGLSGFINSQESTVELRWDFASLESTLYTRAYFKCNTVAGNIGYMLLYFRDTVAQQFRASLYIDDTGHLIVRDWNGSTWNTVDTSTTLVSNGEWFRVDMEVNDTTNQITCDIFVGANIEGSTPDETIGGAATVAGQSNQFRVGMLTAQGAGDGQTFWMDEIEIDDAVMPAPIGTTAVAGRPAVLVLRPGGTATDVNDWG